MASLNHRLIRLSLSSRKDVEDRKASIDVSLQRDIRKLSIKDSKKIILLVSDQDHQLNAADLSTEKPSALKTLYCVLKEDSTKSDCKVEKRPMTVKSKSCCTYLFHIYSLFILKNLSMCYITSIYGDGFSFCSQIYILCFMGILNLNRNLHVKMCGLFVLSKGKKLFCSIFQIFLFDKCKELIFREKDKICSGGMVHSHTCKSCTIMCHKIQNSVQKSKIDVHHNMPSEYSKRTITLNWKAVKVTKELLLRKLMKFSSVSWSKSKTLERTDVTHGHIIDGLKSLTECQNEAKNDNTDGNDVSRYSLVKRMRNLFHISAEVLTWRFERTFPIYYVLKQPNPMMENKLFRLSTYSNWPEKAPQIFSAYLVDAGFYFDQNSEEILCFSCGLCINVSELEFHSSRCSVLRMHLQHSEKCEFALNKMKEISGSDTVDGRKPAVLRDELECSNVELARSNGHSQLNSFVPVVPEKKEYSSMAQVASTTEKDFSYSSMQFAQPTSEEDAVPLCVSSSHQEVVLPSIHLMQKDLSYGQKSRQQNAEVSAAGMPRVYNYDLKHPEYKESEKRMKSFRTPNTPQILIMKMYDIVVAGFFFTGESDIVRCFCCDMGLAEWMEEDVPWEEHAKHSPRCPYLIEEMGEEFISRVQAQWSRIYSPKHPAYTEYNLRLESFRTFPEHVTQSRDEIAAAGFFYTGELDIVRCHYCDGGLRDWEPGDEPWLEHAKWFPFCKYLLKVKGRDYVENAVSSNIEEQASEEVVHNGNHFSEPQDFPQGRPISQSTTNDIDPEVKSVLLSLGYNLTTINRAVAEFRQQRGNRPYNADEIMNIILDMGEREASSTPTFGETATQNHVARSSQSNYLQELTAGEGENNAQELLSPEEIRNQIMCVKCKVNERRILFTPCGHRLLCEKCCNSGISKCLSCGKKIKHKLKTYLS